MIYHYVNKRTGEALVFGSLAVIPDHVEVTRIQLRYCFTDKKELKYEDHTHLIKKLEEVIRSKRKN